jgi:Uma2 family endonuclease
MNIIEVNLDSFPITDEQFYDLCQDNRHLRFERNAKGNLVIMPPTGGETGNKNIEIAYQVQNWSRSNK